MRTLRNASVAVCPIRGNWRKTQPFLWIAIFIAASVTPQFAQDPKVCSGGDKDGNTCNADADCAGTVSGMCTADDVRAYASGCYTRMNIKPTDFPGPFKCKDTTAKQLVVTENGTVEDINLNGQKNPNDAKGFPATCDFPSWLPNGQKQCYGNSYVQKIKVNNDVQAALLCRHKKIWSDGDKDFPDIAMILYNKDNGETCWFQTTDSETCYQCTDGSKKGCSTNADCPGSTCAVANIAHCDGTNVPAPHTQAAASFFLTPTKTSKINCVRCHDNGPWMNSRWMNNVISLEDGDGPYVNNGYGFSTPVDVNDGSGVNKAWAPTTFVTVSRDRIADKNASSCDACHRIHARELTRDLQPGFNDRNYQTFANWLDYSIGNDKDWKDKFPPQSNNAGQAFKVAYWMPAGHSLADAPTWKKTFKNYINLLRACMDGQGKGVENCQPYVPKVNVKPGAAPGARMRASLDGGSTFPWVSEGMSPPVVGNDIPIPAGTRVLLSWEADSTFDACAIEAMFPPGVTSSNGVRTASNWGLPDSPLDVGELFAPGEYRFDLYCDGNFGGNLTFQISGSPPVYISMQPIINQVAGAIARAGSGGPGPNSVGTVAQPTDTIDISWRTYNVIDSSCNLAISPSGPSSADPTGFMQVSPPAGNQTYSLTCLGNDQNVYNVNVSLAVSPP